MIGIYSWTNTINNKKYIGQSKNIHRRKYEHIRASLDINNSLPLYQAIRKYGLSNFIFEVIEECSLDQLDEREVYYIASLQTLVPNGYNLQTGGQDSNESVNWIFFDKSKLLKAYELIQNTNMSFMEIGNLFGVTGTMIGKINRGEHYAIDGYNYPLRNSETVQTIQKTVVSQKLQGENSYRCSITEQVARNIVNDLIYSDLRSTEIAQKYNTSCDVVKDINRGRSWKLIERPIPCRPDHGSAIINEDIVFDIIKMLLDPTKTDDDIYKLDSRISYKMIYRINKGINWRQDFLDYPLRKYCHKKGKLSIQQVLEIIELIHSSTQTFNEIASTYNITNQSVSDINRHKSYAFLSELYPNPIRSK